MKLTDFTAVSLTVARGITQNDADAQECLNDAYLRLWNAIPPERPKSLKAHIAHTVKNIALDSVERRKAKKRSAILLELDECIGQLASDREDDDLRTALNGFPETLERVNVVIFVRRYYYSEPIHASVYLDAFFLAEGAVSILSFRYSPNADLGEEHVTEEVVRIDPQNGDVSVTVMPGALRDAGIRKVIGDSVFFHRADGCIYRLPLNDLSGTPVFVAEAEWPMYTVSAFYSYGFTVKQTATSYVRELDLNAFYRINLDGTQERGFGDEHLRIVETVMEYDGTLYCRAHYDDDRGTDADVYLVAIDLADGTYTVLDTTEQTS